MTVTYQVGGGGHLDIDFWVCDSCIALETWPLTRYTALRPGPTCDAETAQAVTGHRIHNRHKRRTTRILLLKPDELNSGQDRQVCSLRTLRGRMLLTRIGYSFNVHGVIYVDEDGSHSQILVFLRINLMDSVEQKLWHP